jgi:hypothetical protein
MIYYLDISTRELSAEAGGLPITELTLKRRDLIKLQLRWTIDGGSAGVGTIASAKLGIKAAGAYASSFIASAPTMAQTDDDATIFDFNFSLNTAEIDSLFVASSEPSNVKAMLEIQWVDLDDNIGSSKIVAVILTNDVIRGDEGPLAQANPNYPSATDVLTKSGNLAGLADPNSARSVLSVYSSAQVDAAVAAKAAVGSTVASDLGSTGSAGSSQAAARADHVHRKPTLSELGAVSTTDSRLSDARTPVAFDASLITSGTISLSRLPALATSVQVVASGDMTTLTTEQQAQLVTGAIVTTSDGRRWLYKGSGTKTDTANYIEMGDITPEWTSIANKPATFTPSAHTHPQSDVTNLVSDLAARALAADVTTSLAGKSNVGHTHPTSDVTGLDTALANKRTILSGSGIPSAGTGSDGDLYIDTTGNKLYGPKASGAWGSGTFTQGSAGTGSTVSVQSANFTAAVGLRYVTTATLTITDPTGSSAGQTYEVIVGAGTCTIGGSAYVASRLEIVRYYNGSAWITSPSTHSDNLTLNGTGNTAPNQTAATGSSIMTRDLFDRRLIDSASCVNSLIISTATYSANVYTGVNVPGTDGYTGSYFSTTTAAGNYILVSGQSLLNGYASNGQRINFTNPFVMYLEIEVGSPFNSSSTIAALVGLRTNTTQDLTTVTGHYFGVEFLSRTTARIVTAANSVGSYGATVTVPDIASNIRTHVWLENLGSGNVNVYVATGVNKPSISSTTKLSATSGPSVASNTPLGFQVNLIASGTSSVNQGINVINNAKLFLGA